MAAFVNHTFEKGFVLDEERLRKINDILASRGRQVDEACKPAYKVYRADAFSYTTDNIGDVLNENNAAWQKVIGLIASVEHGEDFVLELRFADDSETTLHIEGENRDQVFLVFSDLRHYLVNEVNTIRLWHKNFRGLLLVLAAIPLVLGLSLLGGREVYNYLFYEPDQTVSQSFDAALATQDTQAKLNYLLEQYRPGPRTRSILPLAAGGLVASSYVAVIFVLLFGNAMPRLLLRAFPTHLFLFGKELEREARRKAIRDKVVWGVVVAGIVGIVSSVIAAFVAR